MSSIANSVALRLLALAAVAGSGVSQSGFMCDPAEIVGRTQRGLLDVGLLGPFSIGAVQLLPTGTQDVYEIFATTSEGVHGTVDQSTQTFTPSNALAGLFDVGRMRAMPDGNTLLYFSSGWWRVAQRSGPGAPFAGFTELRDSNNAPFSSGRRPEPYRDAAGNSYVIHAGSGGFVSARLEDDPNSPQFGRLFTPRLVASSASLNGLAGAIPICGAGGSAVALLLSSTSGSGSGQQVAMHFQADLHDGPKFLVAGGNLFFAAVAAVGGCWFNNNLFAPPSVERDFLALPNQALSASGGGEVHVLGGRCPGSPTSGLAAIVFGQTLPGPVATPFGLQCVDAAGGVSPTIVIDGTSAAGSLAFGPLSASFVGLSIGMQAVALSTCVRTPVIQLSNEASLTIGM